MIVAVIVIFAVTVGGMFAYMQLRATSAPSAKLVQPPAPVRVAQAPTPSEDRVPAPIPSPETPAPVPNDAGRAAPASSSAAQRADLSGMVPCPVKTIKIHWLPVFTEVPVISDRNTEVARLANAYHSSLMQPEDQLKLKITAENAGYYEIELEALVFDSEIDRTADGDYVKKEGVLLNLLRESTRIAAPGEGLPGQSTLLVAGRGKNEIRLKSLGGHRQFTGLTYRLEYEDSSNPDRAIVYPCLLPLPKMPPMPDMPPMPATPPALTRRPFAPPTSAKAPDRPAAPVGPGGRAVPAPGETGALPETLEEARARMLARAQADEKAATGEMPAFPGSANASQPATMPDFPGLHPEPRVQDIEDPTALRVCLKGYIMKDWEEKVPALLAPYAEGLFKRTAAYAQCDGGLGPGVSSSQVIASFGQPTRSGPGANGSFDVTNAGTYELQLLRYENKGLDVSLEKDRTYDIKAGPSFKGVLHGIRIGDSVDKVVSIYGPPNDQPYYKGAWGSMRYTDELRSLTIDIDESTGKVTAIYAGYSDFRGSWFTIPTFSFR